MKEKKFIFIAGITQKKAVMSFSSIKIHKKKYEQLKN